MPKRTVTELQPIAEGSSKNRAHGDGDKPHSQGKHTAAEDEMGEFEDAWEDEIESDEEVVNNAPDDDSNGMEVDEQVIPPVEDEDAPEPETEAFIPGLHTLEQDEVLVPDQSAYEMLHRMNVNWPCLSFDILRDNLGFERTRYPATTYLVSGTQADYAKNNEVLVMKMSSMHKTQKDDDSDEEDGGDDEDEDENHLDEDAVLEYRSIKHMGGVNRIRAQPLPSTGGLSPLSTPYHVASWSETGKVHIFNIRPHLEALHSPGSYTLDKSKSDTPVFTITNHGKNEGFAMDWAASSSGLRLLTGDIASNIYATMSTQSSFKPLAQPFTSHTSSIEDLQWSPSEPTVFASCSADKSVRIWDVREKSRKSRIAISDAHSSDVNVISWNRLTAFLLVSGGDEGGIKVWDLRQIKDNTTPSPVAAFTWHTAPITSVEWHPTEDSIFVATGADDQVTLWDLSVEQDDEEMGDSNSNNPSKTEKGKVVPPQLLFVHQGQKDIKEAHWHPQFPGMVVTTAIDGFNVFKTISV